MVIIWLCQVLIQLFELDTIESTFGDAEKNSILKWIIEKLSKNHGE